MKKLVYLILLLLTVSCGGSRKPGNWPDKLVLGIVIQEDPQGTARNRQVLADYLKKELGLKSVKLFLSSDYASIIEAMKANKVDIAQTGELSYIIAHQKAGAEALIMSSLPNRFIPSGSVIITYPGSGLNSMDDVKANAKKLTLLFTDPASTSGHLYPRYYLTKIGLDPESSFKQVSFANGHTAAVLSIKSHNADLACTFKWGLERLIRKGFIKRSDFKILWTSGDYPGVPIYIRGNLPDDFKKRVQKAYLDWPLKEPKTWKLYKDKVMLFYPDSIRDKIIMVPCQDSMLNPIRKIIRETRGFDFGLK